MNSTNCLLSHKHYLHQKLCKRTKRSCQLRDFFPIQINIKLPHLILELILKKMIESQIKMVTWTCWIISRKFKKKIRFWSNNCSKKRLPLTWLRLLKVQILISVLRTSQLWIPLAKNQAQIQTHLEHFSIVAQDCFLILLTKKVKRIRRVSLI